MLSPWSTGISGENEPCPAGSSAHSGWPSGAGGSPKSRSPSGTERWRPSHFYRSHWVFAGSNRLVFVKMWRVFIPQSLYNVNLFNHCWHLITHTSSLPLKSASPGGFPAVFQGHRVPPSCMTLHNSGGATGVVLACTAAPLPPRKICTTLPSDPQWASLGP